MQVNEREVRKNMYVKERRNSEKTRKIVKSSAEE